MTSTEIKELEKKITELREAYWNGECTTPDAEYDKLVEKLRAAEPMNRLLAVPEHGAFTTRAKVMHKVPMLSLQKVYNKVDLLEWMKSVSRSDDEEFIVQPKYDGISCHYDHGVYSTRGDGLFGEDVSEVCKRLAFIAEHTPRNDFYGEIVIRNSIFESAYRNVRRENGEVFKTQRNAVAGILNTDDVDFYAKQGATLTLVSYDMYSFNMKMSEADTKWDIIKGVINALDYPMDGIVVKLADRDWYAQQGCTAHHPKGAMAFKFENVSSVSFLERVDWGMGKEFITATAVFRPTRMNGVTVSRASIPMKSRTLPCVMNGDFNRDAIVHVERAGDVIPHIVKVSKNPDPNATVFSIDKCPFCGSPIEVLESGVRCANDNCWRKSVHRLYDALVQLGIRNVGEATVADLCQKLCDVTAGVRLSWWVGVVPYMQEKIAGLDGYGSLSAGQIVAETTRILHTTLAKFIAALGIPNVGIKIGREIERRFGTVDGFLQGATVESLSALDGVGSVMANRIREWLDTGDHRSYVMHLANKFEFEQPATVQQCPVGSAGGETVCFTGAMRMKRSEMQYVARQHGYVPVDAVTKGLDILVVADGVDMTSSKCVKAQRYGTKVMRETDFLKMCNSALEIQQ